MVKISASGKHWISTFQAIIDYRMRSITFKVPNSPEFKFIGGNSVVKPTKFRDHTMEGLLAHLYSITAYIRAALELIDVFKDFSRLLLDWIVEFVLDLIPSIVANGSSRIRGRKGQVT